MRGRNKPWAKDFIVEHQDLIFDKSKVNGELTLEVGIGKGDFIVGNAKYNNNLTHIGVELNTSIFAVAMKKIVNEGISNVYLLNLPANKLLEYIDEGSINSLYLNFSDPWPQNGYRKRRLVHPIHLEIFEKLLKDNGKIVFKTDNQKLFEFGVENFKQRNYEFEFLSYDYKLLDDDFMTEYEAKFRALGQPIYRAVVKVNKSNLKDWGDKID